MVDRANITSGPLSNSSYYAIRYFNNSDFYHCNKDPGLQNLHQIHGKVFFVSDGNGSGLFTCQGNGMNKFTPGILFAYADVNPTQPNWFDNAGSGLSMDFLPYLYFTRK